jgi:ribosomal protein S18 acetylase RimI-like enzyme
MGENSEWAIRAGTMEDSESVLALWHAAETRPSPTDSELALARLLERDPDSLLLAAGDEIIGSLIVGWDGWRGSFYRLAVHPEWRRQGIASALVRAGEERLQALGAKRLTAIVASGEYAAAALWDAAGYHRQIGMRRFVRMVGD